MAKHINTFLEGIDKDTVVTSYKNTHYYDARNFDIVVAEDLSSATLTNSKGVTTKLIYDVNNVDKKIVGFGETSISIIFFIQCAGVVGEIHELLFTDLAIGSISLDGDTYLVARKDFDFGDRVEVIAREETPLIRKVYWVDGQNPIRFCNLALDVSGYITTQFEINQDVVFTTPTYNRLISGNLKAGVYQYAYCLYNQNAGQSCYSPLSQFIQVSETGLTISSTAFQGSVVGTETTSGIEISVNDSNTNFQYIRVISMFYTTPTAVPEVTIIYEGVRMDSLEISHTGAQLLGTLVLEETIASPLILIPKTIASKYNYLFVGNISEQDFDVEFDARTYRFNSSHVARMYKNDSEFIDITYPNYPTTETEYNLSIKNKLDLDVSPTTGNALYRYRGESAGIPGGQGPNVSYTFVLNTIKFREPVTGLGIWSVNGSIGYSDPLQNDNVGYQRDEIYRFGVIFFNSKGQSSFVKWIGDIRMPHYSENSNSFGITYATDYIRILGINFVFNFTELLQSYPDIVSYQIVRAERTYDTATVVDCGYIGNLQKDDTVLYWGGYGAPTPTNAIYPALHSSTGASFAPKSIVEYICAETNYNKNNDGAYSRLDIHSGNDTHINKRTGTASAYDVDNVILSSLLPSSTFGAIVDIDSTVLFRAQRNLTLLQGLSSEFGGYSLKTRSHIDPEGSRGYKGTTLVMKLASDVSTTTIATLANDHPAYALRRRITYPYGGYSISTIANTTYYPCSSVQSINTSNITVYGGDTYITKFEYMRTMWADGTGSTFEDDRYAQVVQCLVESKLNLDYTSNPRWSTYDDNISNSGSIITNGFMYSAFWEKAGTWEFYLNGGTATQYFIQANDLYTYNPVYSLSTGAKSFVSKPINFVENTEYSTRVSVSEKKTNGEVADSWLQFLPNNSIDIDNQFGPLTRLYNHNNSLFYFQTKGFGIIPVEDREVITTGNGVPVSIGTGEALKRYDYVSTNAGTSLPNSIIGTDSNLYFVDDDLKKLCRLKNKEGFEFLSDINGLYAYMHRADLTSVNTIYNPRTKEIMFSFPTESLKYNEYTNTFISFSDTTFDFGTYKKGQTYVFKNSYDTYWYVSGSALNTGLYGVYSSDYTNTLKTPSTLELILNPARQVATRLDIIELSTEVTSGISNIANETFSTIRLENNYQDTGIILLEPDDNIIRRFRTWRFNDIRNQSDDGRFIDNYAKLTLSFTNDGISKLKVSDIQTSFSPINLR